MIIMIALPLTIGAWALSITVPVAVQGWIAADKIFVPPKDRKSYVGDAPTISNEIPEAVLAAGTPTEAGSAQSLSSATPTQGSTSSGNSDGEPTRRDEPRAGQTATPNPTATPYPSWNGTDVVNILLLGIDKRPSETDPGRSDTIIVVQIDPTVPRVDMFSIPRDLLVAIPGYSDGAKVNSAYPVGESSSDESGGPTLVEQTIELNFGIPIQYYATVDIPGLEDIVDTLGGVVIDANTPLKDDQFPTDDYRYTRAYFPTGLQKLNGEDAVQFARTRHADNDFKRSERQQQLLLAIRDQALASGLITKLPDLIANVGDAVRTDLSLRQTLSLARLAQDLPETSIYTHSITPFIDELNTSQGFFLVGDWESLQWIAQHLPEDPNATNSLGG